MARIIPFRQRKERRAAPRRSKISRRRRRPPSVLVGLVAIGVIGILVLTQNQSGELTAALSGEVRGLVSRVRDGDTIEVARTPVRLDGLHCPEWDEPGGWQATGAMQEMVDGVEVVCHLTGETTYDRQVGRCEARGRDLAASLIRRGLCARCARYDEERRYVEAQAAAGSWTGRMPPYCS